ncbi:hypothetical protein [Kordia sp.]|uniref:hypothetical protein n=1 Tax=Kordia sp. TaxID=1965332 RepID=UPI003B58D4A6
MKKHLIYTFIGIMAFLSCETEKQYSLKQLDGYSFRRNYFGSDTLTGKELDKFIHRNPIQNTDYKSKKGNFYAELTANGIIKNKELIVSKLDSFPNYFDYKISNKTVKLLISFPESFDTEGLILSFREEENIFFTDTVSFSIPPNVTYSTMDLNNDGTDELYMLAKNYAVNGDNYELSIYELTEK